MTRTKKTWETHIWHIIFDNFPQYKFSNTPIPRAIKKKKFWVGRVYRQSSWIQGLNPSPSNCRCTLFLFQFFAKIVFVVWRNYCKILDNWKGLQLWSGSTQKSSMSCESRASIILNFYTCNCLYICYGIPCIQGFDWERTCGLWLLNLKGVFSIENLRGSN